jgi:hypothetical protein
LARVCVTGHDRKGRLGVPGIGPAKLEAYGDELIDLIGLE